MKTDAFENLNILQQKVSNAQEDLVVYENSIIEEIFTYPVENFLNGIRDTNNPLRIIEKVIDESRYHVDWNYDILMYIIKLIETKEIIYLDWNQKLFVSYFLDESISGYTFDQIKKEGHLSEGIIVYLLAMISLNHNYILVEDYLDNLDSNQKKCYWMNFNRIDTIDITQLDMVSNNFLKYKQYYKIVYLFNSRVQGKVYISPVLIENYIKSLAVLSAYDSFNIEEYIEDLNYVLLEGIYHSLSIKELSSIELQLYTELREFIHYFKSSNLLELCISDYETLNEVLITTKFDNCVKRDLLFETLYSSHSTESVAVCENLLLNCKRIILEQKGDVQINEIKYRIGQILFIAHRYNITEKNKETLDAINNDSTMCKGYCDELERNYLSSCELNLKTNNEINDFDIVLSRNYFSNYMTLLKLAGFDSIEDELQARTERLEQKAKEYQELMEDMELFRQSLIKSLYEE